MSKIVMNRPLAVVLIFLILVGGCVIVNIFSPNPTKEELETMQKMMETQREKQSQNDTKDLVELMEIMNKIDQ